MGAPLNLLVIEDSPADYALLTRHLARQGLEAACRRVAGMEDLGLALSTAPRWDAVLSDYNLPGMDFAEAFGLIRQRHPDMIVILVSGTIGEERAVEVLKLGVTDFVLKDNLIRLVPTIRRALDEAAAIRARRRAEGALREREAKYSRLIEATFDCIWETDAEGRYSWISPRIASLLGYNPEQMVGRSRTDFMPEDEARRMDAVFAEIAAECRPFAMVEATFRHQDGREVILESSGLPILDGDGGCAGYLGASRDVTRQRRAEAEVRRQTAELRKTLDTLLRTNSELERLTFAAAHDLQEPIRNIVSFAQMIERRLGGNADADIRQDLSHLVQGAYRLRDLNSGIARLATLGHGTAPWKVHDLGELLAEAERFLAAEIERSGARIVAEALPRALGDGEQLRDLLTCLLSNAIKFARPGMKPEIHVAAHPEDEGWRISVSDNGQGIEPQYLDQIFLPFQRLKAGADNPGVGLGLTMARRIVERHGGRIRADSVFGQGTTISFSLPPLAL